MTSVRTCYCKHEENVARKKDNDIRIHNANRHPVIVVSKKSIVTNGTCGSGRESCKRARRVINERTLDTHRSVEVQLSNSILSPETSTALENAEKIINNAKIQLIEVCATSSFDSARRHRNTTQTSLASKFQDTCSSKLLEANDKTSARSEKRDFPRVTVRRVDLSAPKFRMSRRRRADWSSLGYGSDNRSRGRASPARVLSKDSINNVNVETTARDDRARYRRRMLSARGNECKIQMGPSVHIVDRELVKQDLEDVHISPESSRAQSRANTATYILCHDVIHTNADNRMNDPEVAGTPRTRRVRLDTLQRGKPIEKPITEAATETISVTLVSKLEKEFEDAKNSDAGRDVEQIQSPKVRNYRQEKKDPDSQNAEKVPERLKNKTSQGATKFAMVEIPQIDRNEKLHKARNENHEGILFLSSAGGDTQIRYAEDDEIFCKRSADHQRNVENIVNKIQVEENQSDRSKPSPDDDISRIAGFPRQHENIASRYQEMESPKPHRMIDRHFSHTFNSHNGQDGLHVTNEDVQCRSFASGYTDVFRETIFAEDNLDDIDLYRPCLDNLDSILYSNDRKIERVARVTRNLSELLSDSEFAIYKLDKNELISQDATKFYRNSLNDKDGEYPLNEALNEAARSSLLETELRNEDLTVSKVYRTDDPQAANAAGTKLSAFTKKDGSRSNYSKNSVESSVFPASDANDSPRTSRDSDRTQRSAAKAYLSESSMDRSDATTFSNLVPTLSSTHTEAPCRHQKKEIARDDRHEVTSAKKFSECKIRRSGKEYIDDRIFARFFRKDTSQAADRFLAYILQDEKRSIEGKIASALKESAVTPAAVQKLLNHLREVESIRDARQSETLDILRNILINVKSQSDQGNANDKELFFQNVPDSSARSNAPPNAFSGSREQSVQQTPAKIDGSEVERNFVKNSYELKGLGEHSSDISECRETRESVRSTARCESVQHFANSKKDTGQTGNADVVRIVSIDVKNQTDKDVNENNPKKEEIFSWNVTGSLIRTYATSNVNEETILRAENTNDIGQVNEKSNDSKNPDQYFSPAIPESRESVHFAAAKNSKNSSKNSKNNNSNGNSCSEAESLKQISDIRSDDNENPEENSEHLSTKIASARSKGGSEMEAVDLLAGISVSKNKDDIIIEKLEDDKSNEVVQIDKNQRTNKIVTQGDQVIDARSNIPEKAVKEIISEKTQDSTTPASKRVLFTFAKVSETKNERISSNVNLAKSKFIDEDLTKDVNLVHSSAKENTESLREAKIDPQQEMIKERNPADNNCSTESPRDCVLPKSSESSSRKVASCNKQISFDIAGKDNLTRDMRNEEACKLMMFAVVENRRDGNEISKPQKTATSDNEQQPIDLTGISRKYKIDVLSSSNSSVSSTLLDHDDRSTNGALGADARRVGTTPETSSHSEGELYMPSSCSYSLGEVRVLRRKHDLIEDNAMDRDSSVTVLVTRSMLTSLNDSTMSLLGSSERI
ncbi:uncharacterized protein [Mycetomoellerius zeteki]|uniref:uncharacterized protein n=1 Tax=Mycetomoellerius zeteki TaxID=64791 RepID=UPI00084EBE58|nr:PREDICTED: uncharacterized protein LOC108724140 [Trachymyrmex zeteki]